MAKDLDKPRRGLPTLATEIRQEVEAAEASWQDAVAHAIRAGELLIDAKSQVKHGDWLPWLEANFPGAPRTAQDYMRLAANAENARRVAHLGVRGALKELAAPGEEDARAGRASGLDQIEEVIQRLDAEKPKREDFGDGPLEEARYLLARAHHSDEKLLAVYRFVVANAGLYTAEDPVQGPLLIAQAATGIEFISAQRRCEKPSADTDYERRHAAAQKAWMTYRAAKDASYQADGEPLMDERPQEFYDAMYHPALNADPEAS